MSLPSSLGRAILDTNLAHKTAEFDEPAMGVLRHSWDGVKADQEEALRLLSEAASLFRVYEGLHLAKETQEGDEKAYRNAEIAARIEAFIVRAG